MYEAKNLGKLAVLEADAPEAMKAFWAFNRAALASGAISSKNKELMALAVTFTTPWLAKHKTPPVLEGQSFQLVGSPNRYGLPAFFELHVWAWRENPNGAFVDWNNRVSCEGQ